MAQTKYCWGQGKVESLKIPCADTDNYANDLGDQSLQNGTHFSPEWHRLPNSDVKRVVAQKRGLTASVKSRHEQTDRQTKGTVRLGKCSEYSGREMALNGGWRDCSLWYPKYCPSFQMSALEHKGAEHLTDGLNPAVDTVVSYPVAIVNRCDLRYHGRGTLELVLLKNSHSHRYESVSSLRAPRVTAEPYTDHSELAPSLAAALLFPVCRRPPQGRFVVSRSNFLFSNPLQPGFVDWSTMHGNFCPRNIEMKKEREETLRQN